MKVRENIKCSCCTDTVDSIEHFFAECPVVLEFWKFTEGFSLPELGIKAKLHSTDILPRVQQSKTQKYFIKKINRVILIAQICTSIFQQKKQKKKKERKKEKKRKELTIFPGCNV